MNAVEPAAKASPKVGTEGWGFSASSDCSTVVNTPWSCFSSSTLPSDTVGTRPLRSWGSAPRDQLSLQLLLQPQTSLSQQPRHVGDPAPPTLSQRSQVPGSTCSTMKPGVLEPCSPPSRVPRCSLVPLCPTLPAPGHSGVWAHRSGRRTCG